MTVDRSGLFIMCALGKGGKKLKIYKFLTMYPSSEDKYSELRDSNGVDGLGKIINEPRIIKGRESWRRHFYDDFPKAFNLFKFDLRLVGICARSEDEWKKYFPAEHKEKALRYRPGLFPVHYSKNPINRNYQEMMELESRYLEEKQEHPFLTDLKYFGRILWNIIMNDVRSR